MSVPVKIDIQANGPHMEHTHGQKAAGHGAFAHILGHEMDHAQGHAATRAAVSAHQNGQHGQAQDQHGHGESHLRDRGTEPHEADGPSLNLRPADSAIADSAIAATQSAQHTTGTKQTTTHTARFPALPAVQGASENIQLVHDEIAPDAAATQISNPSIPRDRSAPISAATDTPAHVDVPKKDDGAIKKQPFRSTLHMWDRAQSASADTSAATSQHEARKPEHAHDQASEPRWAHEREPVSSTPLAPYPVAHDLSAQHAAARNDAVPTSATKADKAAVNPSPSPHQAASTRRDVLSETTKKGSAKADASPQAPLIHHAHHVPAAPEPPLAETPVSTPAPRTTEPEAKPTRARSSEKVETREGPRRPRASETHPDLEAAILATLSPPNAPAPVNAPEPSAPTTPTRAAAPQHDVRPHVVAAPSSQTSSQSSQNRNDERELGTGRDKKHAEPNAPVAQPDAAAPKFPAHFAAPAMSSPSQPKGEIPPPGPPLPVDAAPLANRIAEDPGLTMAVMPQAARLAIDAPDGDLELHLRVRDGSADISVSGSMAPLFDHRAPEVRAALASEGLGLGHYDLNQQGNQGSAWQGAGQGGQQGQWQPPSDRDAPAPGPAPAKAAAVARAETGNQSVSTTSGHIHVTA